MVGGAQGSSPMSRRKRIKPTDSYCEVCLEQVVSLEISRLQDSDYPSKLYLCENCKRKWMRSQVLTFDEMTKVKFARAKYKSQ